MENGKEGIVESSLSLTNGRNEWARNDGTMDGLETGIEQGGTELRTGEGGRRKEGKNNSTSHLPNGHFNGELWIEPDK